MRHLSIFVLFRQSQQDVKRFAALRRLGLRRTAVGHALGAGMPFVPFFSATFFCARKNASHLSLSGAKKRQLQPERYVPCLKLF
jgi:hypothetical protein